jgi:peptidyl-prolyl cis-trans isomerase D
MFLQESTGKKAEELMRERSVMDIDFVKVIMQLIFKNNIKVTTEDLANYIKQHPSKKAKAEI